MMNLDVMGNFKTSFVLCVLAARLKISEKSHVKYMEKLVDFYFFFRHNTSPKFSTDLVLQSDRNNVGILFWGPVNKQYTLKTTCLITSGRTKTRNR